MTGLLNNRASVLPFCFGRGSVNLMFHIDSKQHLRSYQIRLSHSFEKVLSIAKGDDMQNSAGWELIVSAYF